MPRRQLSGSLNILHKPASATPGYLQASDLGGNAIPYCYRFSGGTDGEGGIEVSKNVDGDTVYVVVSIADPRYRIQSVAFYGDLAKTIPIGANGPNDVFAYVIARNKRSVLIDDDIASHSGNQADFYYSIVVKDTGAGGNGQMIVCDPTIKNKQLM